VPHALVPAVAQRLQDRRRSEHHGFS
jgi:hypothetical protein